MTTTTTLAQLLSDCEEVVPLVTDEITTTATTTTPKKATIQILSEAEDPVEAAVNSEHKMPTTTPRTTKTTLSLYSLIQILSDFEEVEPAGMLSRQRRLGFRRRPIIFFQHFNQYFLPTNVFLSLTAPMGNSQFITKPRRRRPSSNKLRQALPPPPSESKDESENPSEIVQIKATLGDRFGRLSAARQKLVLRRWRYLQTLSARDAKALLEKPFGTSSDNSVKR